MITLYDHVQALRAELRSCHLSHRERGEAKSELARAVVQQADRDRVFDAVFEIEIHRAEASG